MRLFIIILLSLSLSACVKQEDADIKMAKGCEAGINALLADQNKQIKEIKVQRYANEEAEGGLHRRITIEAIEKDGWLELEKQYSCLFMQEWGFFKSSHNALLVQIQMGDEIYGKKDGKILGNLQDFLNLTGVVERAMSH